MRGEGAGGDTARAGHASVLINYSFSSRASGKAGHSESSLESPRSGASNLRVPLKSFFWGVGGGRGATFEGPRPNVEQRNQTAGALPNLERQPRPWRWGGRCKGLRRKAARAKFGEVSGVIHFYYHAAPAGGRSGKLFLKQSGGLSSELLPACSPGQRRACRG